MRPLAVGRTADPDARRIELQFDQATPAISTNRSKRCSAHGLNNWNDHLIDQMTGTGAGGITRNRYDQAKRRNDGYQLPSGSSGKVSRHLGWRPCDPPKVAVIRRTDRRSTLVVWPRGFGDVSFWYQLPPIPSSALEKEAADLRHITSSEGEPKRTL